MHRIVIGYDGSEHARRAIDRAVEIAAPDAEVWVVTVAAVSPGVVRGPASAAAAIELGAPEVRASELDEARARLAAGGIGTVHVVEDRGSPAHILVQQAADVSADVIVVGSRGHGLAGRLLLGSVSTAVLHHAPCDVLIVR